MPIPTHLTAFWNGFVKCIGSVDDARFYEAFFFGDSPDLANELAALVLRGVKRATAGAVWSYEAEGKRLPVPGDLSIVTSWLGEPLCVIETQAVDVLPFAEVSAEFAAAEGEGDGSLTFWQAAHSQYFTRECARAGRQFAEDMLVACERFTVVYRPSADAAMPPIRCACLVDTQGSKLLLVRVRQNEHWYLPGGKLEPDESAQSALQREVAEELGIALAPESIRYLYSVVGPAYGQTGDVELICFAAQWAGEPRAHGEISEVQWLDYRDEDRLAPAVKLLCRQHLLGECAPAHVGSGNEA
jgi:uncharacterized protein YhfF/8-oxo-dGTP pyrophosphatase MutT (NUDIX family)